MRLKRDSSGVYVTEDGRYEIQVSVAYSECDEPHPVRISRADIQKAQEAPRPEALGWPFAKMWAARNGKKGYHCEGGEEHGYDSWGVWDREKDDYIDDSFSDFRTKKEAVAALERYLRRG